MGGLFKLRSGFFGFRGGAGFIPCRLRTFLFGCFPVLTRDDVYGPGVVEDGSVGVGASVVILQVLEVEVGLCEKCRGRCGQKHLTIRPMYKIEKRG